MLALSALLFSFIALPPSVGVAGQGRSADPFPYFKPDPIALVQIPIEDWEPTREYSAAPPHPVAQECPINDGACLATHDTNVLDIALLSQAPATCERSTRPQACQEAYRMITGDVDPPLRWAGLDDPCTLVVRVDSGVATLYSPRTMQTRRTPDGGWRAGGYLGACDVASMGLTTKASLQSLPQFPWQSTTAPR